jgi:aldose 1-epimerase
VTRITIAAGDLTLDLAPGAGGAVAAFRAGATPLLRPTSDPEEADVRAMAAYPLIPYSNRIAGGRFVFDGTAHALRLNFGDHPNSIHGNAWQRAWTVAEAGPDAARLTLDHDPARDGADGWPFAYRAEQRFALDARGLTLTLRVENAAPRGAPAGLGWHPFFPLRDGTTLRFDAARVWLNDADMLPVAQVDAPRDWDFHAPRPPRGAGLDNCFAGWGGSADVAWPDAGLALRMTAGAPFGHLVVYTAVSGETVAVEPVSHMNDAVNRMGDTPGHGLRTLAPGEALEGTIRLDVGGPP